MICQKLRDPISSGKEKKMYLNVFFKIIFRVVVGKFFVKTTFQRCLSCYLNMSLENVLRLLLLKTVVFKRNEISCPSAKMDAKFRLYDNVIVTPPRALR